MVSELAALSKRNEYSALDLDILSSNSDIITCLSYFADILRYARVGVRISAGMVAHIGTRFGGLGEPFDVARTSCTVSKDGCISNCMHLVRL